MNRKKLIIIALIFIVLIIIVGIILLLKAINTDKNNLKQEEQYYVLGDGIYEKTHNMTTESMGKIGDTIEKVMNENSGLVCLIV